MLLVGQQEGHPAYKNWVMRCWCRYLSGARCKLSVYGPADGTANHRMLLHWNPGWLTFLVPAYSGCPGKRLLNGCNINSEYQCTIITRTLYENGASADWLSMVTMTLPFTGSEVGPVMHTILFHTHTHTHTHWPSTFITTTINSTTIITYCDCCCFRQEVLLLHTGTL